MSVAEARAGRVGCLKCHQPQYTSSGSCISCHRGDGRSDRLAIAHRDLIRAKYSWFAVPGSAPLERGGKLLEGFACRRCHTSAGKGNRLASNLDRLAPGVDPRKIHDAIQTPALFMPRFAFDDRQAVDLVNAILAGAHKAKPAGGEAPQVVHFEKAKRQVDNVFQKRCGPCHKALTEANGALGKGDIGPNLSGLFSQEYPPIPPPVFPDGTSTNSAIPSSPPPRAGGGRGAGVGGTLSAVGNFTLPPAPSRQGRGSVSSSVLDLKERKSLRSSTTLIIPSPGGGGLGRGSSRWDQESLRKWLENPRKVREQTQMRPVPLEKEEFDQLLSLLAMKKAGQRQLPRP
jgi:cytochrome c2